MQTVQSLLSYQSRTHSMAQLCSTSSRVLPVDSLPTRRARSDVHSWRWPATTGKKLWSKLNWPPAIWNQIKAHKRLWRTVISLRQTQNMCTFSVKTPFSRNERAVQFKIVSMRSEKPIYAPPSISEISPLALLPFKRFQCSSDWRWPSLVLSRKIV